MYHFIKQNYIEAERGVEYINYQKEVATHVFLTKRRLKDPKMMQLIKAKKKTIKTRIMCQF